MQPKDCEVGDVAVDVAPYFKHNSEMAKHATDYAISLRY